MSSNRIRRTALAVVTAVAVAVIAAGCASAPESSGTSGAAGGYCARMVTNSGGLNDRSFNESSWAGMQQAAKAEGIKVRALVSTGETDLAPNVKQAAESGCGFVLTVGYELADATAAQAKANPDVHFAIVDEVVEAGNVKPIIFDTAQASYLAGYLAAGVSKTGVVATYGGGNQPPVTLFMDGFVDGVAKYNEVHGTAVKALGWDVAKQDGSFTGDFEDISKGQTLTESLIDQGADVILPVAGQVGEGTAAAALEHPGVSVVWVDNDGYESLPAKYHPVLLTSVLKNTTDAVAGIIGSDVKGKFDSAPFIGTLENDGVALAPFHDLASSVPAALSTEIDGLKADIVSGKLVVSSPSTPR